MAKRRAAWDRTAGGVLLTGFFFYIVTSTLVSPDPLFLRAVFTDKMVEAVYLALNPTTLTPPPRRHAHEKMVEILYQVLDSKLYNPNSPAGRAGIVGMRGCMVVRLRPWMT